jgi:hypothetical protein
MRRSALLAVAAAAALFACASPAGAFPLPDGLGVNTHDVAATGTYVGNGLTTPPTLDRPPQGYQSSADQVTAVAARPAKVRAAVRSHRGAYSTAYEKGPGEWQVSWFAPNGGGEIAQVTLTDSPIRVLEVWTGYQVAWQMARGYPGAFGRKSNALFIWLPLCLLFLVPFFDVRFRRGRRMLNLDLVVLLSLSVSLAYFNHADIYASVPLSYPPLVYLLVRMLCVGLRRGAPSPGPLRLNVPASWLAVGVVFLLGFRIGLDVTDANVIDVGYAGVIGAQHIVAGKPLYGHFPSDNTRGDTYGPVAYEAYVPFEQTLGFSGHWDDLPAARGASIFFDLLCVALLVALGRRIRGPSLGAGLAYMWVSFPFTLFALASNTNDALVAALVLAAILAASSPPARGAFAALAALTKVAPLGLFPLFATHGLRAEPSRGRRARMLALFLLGFAGAAALALWPVFAHSSLREMFTRVVTYQATRGAPFSVWGLYGGLGWAQTLMEGFAVALAVLVAVLPRRDDLIGLAALAAAVLIAVQLSVTYWFYLYIPWFFAPLAVALLGRHEDLLDRVRPEWVASPYYDAHDPGVVV